MQRKKVISTYTSLQTDNTQVDENTELTMPNRQQIYSHDIASDIFTRKWCRNVKDKITKLFNLSQHRVFYSADVRYYQGPCFLRQILPNSAAQFVKFREILWHYHPQIAYIPRPVGDAVLTDNTSKYWYKEVTRKRITLGH